MFYFTCNHGLNECEDAWITDVQQTSGLGRR